MNLHRPYLAPNFHWNLDLTSPVLQSDMFIEHLNLKRINHCGILFRPCEHFLSYGFDPLRLFFIGYFR